MVTHRTPYVHHWTPLEHYDLYLYFILALIMQKVGFWHLLQHFEMKLALQILAAALLWKHKVLLFLLDYWIITCIIF
jgi:hypothetical protein